MRPFLAYLRAAALAALVVPISGSAASAVRESGPRPDVVVEHARGAAGILPVEVAADLAGGASSSRPLDAAALHAFSFTRAIYSDGGNRWGRGAWATDYPKADMQFLTVLRRLTNLDAYYSENAVALDDPELRRFPFIYMLEVGYMQLTPAERQGLRDYLLAGGFAFVDDFWGTYQWRNFEQQMRLVLPEYSIVDLPLDHAVFNSLYRIDEIVQVPAVGFLRRGRTWEQDGYEPFVRAILDETGRMMMMINGNTDIGDAWEWAEQPDYPLSYSTYAYQVGANAIVYSMSH